MSASVDRVFSSSGPIAGRLGTAFELRPQQVEMAAAISAALEERSALLVEAGTGIGKSFAYLIPAMQRIVASGGEERVVVATNTIALQEQLIHKDIPFLREALAASGEEGASVIRPELVKGRGNYLSIRRLQLASSRQERLFADEPARRSLHVIEDWAYTTTDGSLSTLPKIERAGIWDRVESDSGNCMGRKCRTYDQCFYQNARRRMEKANLLVCNHALFFSDLALRKSQVGFLPPYQHVILDEAHGVEDVASDHFGLSLAEGRVRHLLAALYQPKRQRGFLSLLATGAGHNATVERAVAMVIAAGEAADDFFGALIERVGGEVGSVRLRGTGTGATPGGPIENGITPVFRELALVLKRLKDGVASEEDRYELNAYAQRAGAIADEAALLVAQGVEGCVYWIETTANESYGVRTTLACSPIEVAPILREHLFGAGVSVVLTSATLTTGRASFDHTRARLGCEPARALLLGSPFDHAAQVELHVDSSMPDPRSDRYAAELARRVRTHVEATDGGAFVLFTSFKAMHRVADLVRPELEKLGMAVWVHGRDGPRGQILARFRENERSVLFGTASFWQGVDVPGRALRNVIITRLPFDPPDRPLTQARLEAIEARGGNAFIEDSLPRAVIRFKQGFGRLVRTAGDTGRVVVLDSRLVTARYGRLFLEALPAGVRVLMNGEGVASSGDAD